MVGDSTGHRLFPPDYIKNEQIKPKAGGRVNYKALWESLSEAETLFRPQNLPLCGLATSEVVRARTRRRGAITDPDASPQRTEFHTFFILMDVFFCLIVLL